jgi:hypothetical protein
MAAGNGNGNGIKRAFQLLLASHYGTEIEAVVRSIERHLRLANEEGIGAKDAAAIAVTYIVAAIDKLCDHIVEARDVEDDVVEAMMQRRKRFLEYAGKYVLAEASGRASRPPPRKIASPARLAAMAAKYRGILANEAFMEKARALDAASMAHPELRRRLVRCSNELRLTGDTDETRTRIDTIVPLALLALREVLGYAPSALDVDPAVWAWVFLDAHDPSNDADWKRGQTRWQRRASGKD